MAQNTRKMDVGRLVRIGMMCAISTVLSIFPEIPMAFFAPWLKLDFSYVPVLLTGFSLGIWPGVAVLTVKNIYQLLTTNSAGVGQLADMLMGIAMLLPATLVYNRNRTRRGALIGMLLGVLSMVVVGVLVNRFILLPFYLGGGFAAYMEKNPYILWIAVAPFNAIKGGVVCIITFVLYKHLSRYLKNGLKG